MPPPASLPAMIRLSRRALLAATAGLAGCTTVSPGESSDERPVDTGSEPAGSPGTSSPTDPPGGTDGVELAEPETAWAVAFDRPIHVRPTVAGDAVIVATGEQAIGTPIGDDAPRGDLAAVSTGTGAVRWHASLPVPARGRPVVHEGIAYVVAGHLGRYAGVDQRLVAVDDGGVAWESNLVDRKVDLLDIGGGRAYLGTSDDHLEDSGEDALGVDLSDGQTDWRVEVGDAFDGRFLGDRLLVDVAGVVLRSLDPGDGSEQWSLDADVESSFGRSVAVGDGAVFVSRTNPDGGETLASVDLDDGTVRWTYDGAAPSPFVVVGADVGDGVVVGTEHDGVVFALDPADGSEQWVVETEYETTGPPLLADGTVYVSDVGGVVHSLDAADGAERWRADPPGGPHWLSVGDGLVVAAGHGGGADHVVALDVGDGGERWHFATREDLTRPTVGDGLVFVGSDAGLVRALGP